MRPTTTPAPSSRALPWPGRFLADERGATAIEYALLAAVVAILAIGGLQQLSSGTGGLYEAMDAISAAIEDAVNG
jgi:Flp pilus assembly pilin Flp